MSSFGALMGWCIAFRVDGRKQRSSTTKQTEAVCSAPRFCPFCLVSPFLCFFFYFLFFFLLLFPLHAVIRFNVCLGNFMKESYYYYIFMLIQKTIGVISPGPPAVPQPHHLAVATLLTWRQGTGCQPYWPLAAGCWWCTRYNTPLQLGRTWCREEWGM